MSLLNKKFDESMWLLDWEFLSLKFELVVPHNHAHLRGDPQPRCDHGETLYQLSCQNNGINWEKIFLNGTLSIEFKSGSKDET